MATKKDTKEKPTWQDRAERELKEFGKLGWREARGFGAAALHIAGVLGGFSSSKGSKRKK